jgi:exopolyphosphatase / guanosine-5'-triphosphate,3'-diphosphate pyrophosphatase
MRRKAGRNDRARRAVSSIDTERRSFPVHGMFGAMNGLPSQSGLLTRPEPPAQRPFKGVPTLAALDLGTNNCRLLIARPQAGGRFKIIDAFSRVVRLGEGLSRAASLSETAMARTLQALHVCQQKLQRHGASHVRAVATEACRRADNGRSFLEQATAETGIAIDIISPAEEARLALAGCAPLLNPAIPRALAFDIGGGSTELVWAAIDESGAKVIDQISIPCGVVNLTELYGGDRVSLTAYQAMSAMLAEALADFDARNAIGAAAMAGQAQMLGASGTVTTLAGIQLGLSRYDRSLVDGTFLERNRATAIVRDLLDLDYQGRSEHACVGRSRADLVIAGCAILEAIWGQWPFARLRIADRGVREGILVDLAVQAETERRRRARRRHQAGAPSSSNDRASARPRYPVATT